MVQHRIQQILSDLRNNPLTVIDGERIATLSDYNSSIEKNLITGEEKQIDLAKVECIDLPNRKWN